MNGSAVYEDGKAFLASTLQRLIGALKAHSGSLFLFNHENNELVLSAYYNAKGFVLTDIKKKMGEGVAGCAIKVRTPILVKDIDTDPRFNRNGFAHYRGKSFISIPLYTGDHLIGLINITDKDSGEPFTEQDLMFADNELKLLLKKLEDQRTLVAENESLKEKLAGSSCGKFLNITGKHPKMRKIFALVEAVANTRATVLINGESGTGKRLIAHAIHNCDPIEQKKPFVEVSCGALTETLLDSELFGHVKGAFTGAFRDRTGRFELADKGTIFLDEIDSFSLSMQAKLLRVIQDGEFERVGDSKTIKVDIRIIAATNQDLNALIEQGKFRKDLYYRLNIINIALPPLRERVSDIPLLAHDLIGKHSKQLGKDVKEVAGDVMQRFTQYSWPGNIREMENAIERATILAKGQFIGLEDLPDYLTLVEPQLRIESDLTLKVGGESLKSAIKDSEYELIMQALEAAEGSRTKTAQSLGIDRTTLYKKMVSYGMLKVTKGKGKKALALAT
ncbi:MAG: sigma-54-dependent Fis family transcriptional regulator [Candidatus Omnitrophica bacterium]|nr:sigma-54-dependent Fis family transcriptional regulator [Candidatus Omnitrophota bacterium]